MIRRLTWLLLAAAVASCGGDPIAVVQEATTLCPAGQPFADTVTANIVDPRYRVGDSDQAVEIVGRVIYLGDPVEVAITLDDDEPVRFAVNSPPLAQVSAEEACRCCLLSRSRSGWPSG